MEEAYLGYRTERADGLSVELWGGSRALKLGPRKAWELAGIARFGCAGFKNTTFYLDPNETDANDSRTTLVGNDFRYDGETGGFAGLTFAHVPTSEAPYPKAAPGGIGAPSVLPVAREGLNALNVYARTKPFAGSLSGLFLATDLAYEWNDDIDLRAWAGRGQFGYRFEQRSWRPSLMYAFQTFSGDDPGTARLERFDPLFFEGSPSSWSTGSKSSFTFINSNVRAHQLSSSISPTKKDTVTLRYAHIAANELRSPVQFGQAVRFDLETGEGVVAGVTNRHLADDIFLDYMRVINEHTFLTSGISASFPGRGLDLAANKDLPVWLGGFVNVVINY